MPDRLKKVSKNSSLILGGQVISNQLTNLSTYLARTHVKGILGDLYGQKWTVAQFLLVASFGQEKDQRKNIYFIFLPSVYSLHSILGLVSRGRGCAQAHYPGIYTRVTLYLFSSHHPNPDCEKQVKSHLSWIYAHVRRRVKYKVEPRDEGQGHSFVKVRTTWLTGQHAKDNF